MAAVGSISIGVSAKTDKFTKGMGRAGKSTKSFTKGISNAKKAMAGFAALVGAGMIVRGVKQLVLGQLEAVDSTGKFADKIGISVEQLTRLQHAGELSGVSAGNLNTGLQRMTRRVAEAAQGSKGLIQGLTDLGLRASDLIKMSPDQQFLAIAQAMSKVKTQSEKVRLTFKFFDTEGVGLVNTMKLITNTAGGALREADKLGLTFTDEQRKVIEKANDAMTRMGAVFTGLKRTLTIELAPVITLVADAFTDWATKGEGVGAKLAGIFTKLRSFVDTLHTGFLAVEATIMGIPSSYKTAIGSLMATTGEFFAGQGGFISEKVAQAVGFVGGKGAAEGLRDTGLAMMTTGLEEEQAVWKKYNDKKLGISRRLRADAMTNAEAMSMLMGETAPAGKGGRRRRRRTGPRTLIDSPRYRAFLRQKMIEGAKEGKIGAALTGQMGPGPFGDDAIAAIAAEFAGERQGRKFAELMKHGKWGRGGRPAGFSNAAIDLIKRKRVRSGLDMVKLIDAEKAAAKATKKALVPGARDMRVVNVNDAKAQKILTSIRDEVAGGFVAVTA